MSKAIEAVLFDLDGTLLDTAPDFELVLNRLLVEQGHQALPFQQIRKTVSSGAKALVTMAFDIDESHENFPALRQRLLDLYQQHLADSTAPFKGIAELLSFLGQLQIPWGVVTNKPIRYTEPLMAKMDLQPSCQVVVCPDHVSQTKPHPEALLLACKQLQCEPASAIYVGDHRRDIEAGNAANMLTIAAAYGYIDETDPAKDWCADHIVDSVVEIRSIIEERLNTLD